MTYNINISKEAGQPAIACELNIDWNGVTEEDLKQWALKSIIISVQAKCRTAAKRENNPEPIPTKLSVKALDYKVGTRTVATNKLPDLLAKLSTEEKAALIAKLSAELNDEV